MEEVVPYQDISFHNWVSDSKYGFFFKTRHLLVLFQGMLENRCKLCPYLSSLSSFRKLKEHAYKAHGLYFCEICVENLKLFPTEFKMYTRPKLTIHRRDGDADDRSHKGHPYCEFCDERYLDNDALHMHLRKTHFWCHFCESDGKQDYYPDHHSLRNHFKKDHYLCEEGACRHDILTSTFRNEIDLKAHRANVHSKGLTKAEVKQMRFLPVEFSFNSNDTAIRRGQSSIRGVAGGGHFRDDRSR